VAVAAVLVCVGSATGTAPRALQPPSLFDPLVAPRGDRVLTARTDVPRHAWGGTFTTASGESVELWISDAYAEDRTVAQRWVDYVGALVHGAELARVTIFLGSPDEVVFLCGYGALACYQPLDELIMVPVEDIPGVVTAEGALAHEYGHHVAQNRFNTPWNASDYGTKTWATHVGVCRAVVEHQLFPGDQAIHYRQNPSEIFAESYRVLNERRLGRVETSWRIVDQRYDPDEAGLRALERDVVAPWRANTTVTVRALTPRPVTTATALDGSFDVRLAGARATLVLASSSGKILARSANGTLRGLVCGQRALTVRVAGRPPGAPYSLRISRP
jgi:hypothetical protein